MTCDSPHCGSRNTTALNVINQDGTRDFHSHRQGWFVSSRSIGSSRSTTRGRSQTRASQLAEAPVPSMTRFLQGGGVTASLILGMLLGAAAVS